jgi:hypothetical protein
MHEQWFGTTRDTYLTVGPTFQMTWIFKYTCYCPMFPKQLLQILVVSQIKLDNILSVYNPESMKKNKI